MFNSYAFYRAFNVMFGKVANAVSESIIIRDVERLVF